MDLPDEKKKTGAASSETQGGKGKATGGPKAEGQPKSKQAITPGLNSGIVWAMSLLKGGFLDDFSVFASVAGFLLLAFSLLFYPVSIFPYKWFPSMLAVWGFKVAFGAWALSEIINAILSRNNSKSASQDKNSYWAVSISTWIAVIATFFLRGLEFGTFG
ncbi:MAG TPA: hypothetical protein PLO51_01925, partial [Candidatus Micrarchaeota archaeon]|nr:hypothetical protein [Candidatus Micrarchaeota archaeon]